MLQRIIYFVWNEGPPSQPERKRQSFSRALSGARIVDLAKAPIVRLELHQIVETIDQLAHLGVAAHQFVGRARAVPSTRNNARNTDRNARWIICLSPYLIFCGEGLLASSSSNLVIQLTLPMFAQS